MRILLYSDVHISRTSSILPTTYKDTNLTYRQAMMNYTSRWLGKLARDNKPDLIINLGDTFDQNTLTSYDTEIARQFFGEFSDINIPHYVLIGNHEMVNEKFNSAAMLDNISNIYVIKDPTSINIGDKKLAFLPYRDSKSLTELPEGDYLFSHIDIYGSPIKGIIKLEAGITTDVLKQRYKLVFNGHIHKSSIFDNVINIGSCTTHSFADDDEWEPHAYIFNTETNNLETFTNMFCPLFRTLKVGNATELTNKIEQLNKQHRYVLNVNCPYEMKDIAKKLLDQSSTTIMRENDEDKDFVIRSKLSITINKAEKEKLQEVKQINDNIQTNIDVERSFRDFLEVTDLKFPKQYYLDILS